MAEKLVVIGGTAAGLSAASRAKGLRPELDIVVFEKSGYISYGSCGLPYFVGGMIEQPEELVAVSPADMRNKRGIPVWTHHEVTAIDRVKKTVSVINLDTGESGIHPYDKLVIATGAAASVPPIPGIKSPGVYCLRNVEDGIRLREAARGAGEAAIIGGGFIGLELAEQLSMAGLKVRVFEQLPRLLPFLDSSFSQMVKDSLERWGVTVYTGTGVAEILTEHGRARWVRTPDGETYTADLVLASTGVNPATGLAQAAGLKLGLKNGIAVDSHMQTGDPDVWACGDCVEMKHLITGKPVYIPLGTTANKQGRAAGAGAAGVPEEFRGVLGSMVTKVFDLYVAATGLSLGQARDAGFQAVSTIITKMDKASYYPGGKENHICLITEEDTGRLLGAQAVGSESVAGRINVMAAAITCGMTAARAGELDLVYAPPVAPVYDPILIAARQAAKKTGRRA